MRRGWEGAGGTRTEGGRGGAHLDGLALALDGEERLRHHRGLEEGVAAGGAEDDLLEHRQVLARHHPRQHAEHRRRPRRRPKLGERHELLHLRRLPRPLGEGLAAALRGVELLAELEHELLLHQRVVVPAEQVLRLAEPHDLLVHLGDLHREHLQGLAPHRLDEAGLDARRVELVLDVAEEPAHLVALAHVVDEGARVRRLRRVELQGGGDGAVSERRGGQGGAIFRAIFGAPDGLAG